MEKDEKIKNAKVVEMIKVELIRGDGTKENPARIVTQYWDFNGKLIYDVDEFKMLSAES